MKPHFSNLTAEQQATFGNGCTLVPDFIFTANCRHHDFNYCRGGYLVSKMKADYDMCFRMFDDACDSNHPVFYALISILYFIGLTFLPFSYFFFTWGRWRSVNDILVRDMMNKILDI